MSWFKVDDKFYDHPKARKAGKAAVGVWVLSGTWSADHLTDGFVPATVLPRWGTRGDAKKLVDAGLWEPATFEGEPGWRFLSWQKYQPTRAEKKAQREKKAEAGRAGGLASGRTRREASTKQCASGLVEPPSRPVPLVVTSSSQSGWLTRALDGLTDDDVDRISERLRCSHDHARKVAADVLCRSQTPVAKPMSYVFAALDAEPGRYRPTPTPGRLDDACPVPGHDGYPAGNCAGCRSEQMTGGA